MLPLVKSKRIDKKGFTVLELIVVASIMAMLLVLVMANFRGFESKSVLETEVDKLASVLRQAQIYSLTGQTVAGTRYNYGVHLEKCVSGSCSYVLFGDTGVSGTDKRYDNGEENNSGSRYNIITGAYIESVSPNDSNKLDIIFVAPLGDIYFNNSQANETAQIVLKHTQSGSQRLITVNRISGQINIQ